MIPRRRYRRNPEPASLAVAGSSLLPLALAGAAVWYFASRPSPFAQPVRFIGPPQPGQGGAVPAGSIVGTTVIGTAIKLGQTAVQKALSTGLSDLTRWIQSGHLSTEEWNAIQALENTPASSAGLPPNPAGTLAQETVQQAMAPPASNLATSAGEVGTGTSLPAGQAAINEAATASNAGDVAGVQTTLAPVGPEELSASSAAVGITDASAFQLQYVASGSTLTYGAWLTTQGLTTISQGLSAGLTTMAYAVPIAGFVVAAILPLIMHFAFSQGSYLTSFPQALVRNFHDNLLDISRFTWLVWRAQSPADVKSAVAFYRQALASWIGPSAPLWTPGVNGYLPGNPYSIPMVPDIHGAGDPHQGNLDTGTLLQDATNAMRVLIATKVASLERQGTAQGDARAPGVLIAPVLQSILRQAPATGALSFVGHDYGNPNDVLSAIGQSLAQDVTPQWTGSGYVNNPAPPDPGPARCFLLPHQWGQVTLIPPPMQFSTVWRPSMGGSPWSQPGPWTVTWPGGSASAPAVSLSSYFAGYGVDPRTGTLYYNDGSTTWSLQPC